MRRDKPRYFKAIKRAQGAVSYKWEPSSRDRERGWKPVSLGRDMAEAVRKAQELNQRLDDWRRGACLPADAAAVMRPASPRHYRLADLIRAFETGPMLKKAEKTQREYRHRLRAIEAWGDDGRMLLMHIDRDAVMQFRDALVGEMDGAPGMTPHNAAATLRVLSLLFGWGEQAGYIRRGSNPATRLKIPTVAPRIKRVDSAIVDLLDEAAVAAGWPAVALAIRLAFFTLQRPGDLRDITEINWRPARNISAHDRDILSGGDGRAMTIRVRQTKTGTWVSCPVDRVTRDRIDATFAARRGEARNSSLPLIVNANTGERFHERVFLRRWHAVVAKAIEIAGKRDDGDALEQLAGLQFRDFRRSGMCWMRDNGATIAQIAARSGHSIAQTTKILETYLPADEGGSAAGFATALRGTDAARNAQSASEKVGLGRLSKVGPAHNNQP